MGLVDYASDDSDGEIELSKDAKVLIQPATSAKPAFQKVVDKHNPHKIRVTLPNDKSSTTALPEPEPEPKRIKLGPDSGRRGINAFLPAPKKPSTNQRSGQSGPGRGTLLRPGMSLKTGAEPGFTREPMEAPIPPVSEPINDPLPSEETSENPMRVTVPVDDQMGEVKKTRKATRFMPLSVSRKPNTKTKIKPLPQPSEDDHVQRVSQEDTTKEPHVKDHLYHRKQDQSRPTVSLFSVASTENGPTNTSPESSAPYQPILYGTETTSGSHATSDGQNLSQQAIGEREASSSRDTGSQSLDAIALDLNLSASERRRLFGRSGPKSSTQGVAKAVNVVNFNTDAEYTANEELRMAGEQPDQQHRAVRTVNTAGKNSLRSLVNVINNQGEALEEHFAKGRRNKQEAGSKYGW